MVSRRGLLTGIFLTLFFFASSSAREPTCHPWEQDSAIMNAAAILASQSCTQRGELAQGVFYTELPIPCGSSDEERSDSEENCASTESEFLPCQNSTFVAVTNSKSMNLAAEAMCRLSRCNPETGLWQVWQGAATCILPTLTQNQSFLSLLLRWRRSSMGLLQRPETMVPPLLRQPPPPNCRSVSAS